MQYLWIIALGFIWWISQWKPSWKGNVKAGQTSADVLAEVLGEVDEANRIEALSWADWLSVEPWQGMQGDVDKLAQLNGGPADWSAFADGGGRGWHTPCGPDDDKNKYCAIVELQTLKAASTVA